MSTRDPRKEPRPGDEAHGPVVKAKVLRVTLDDNGICAVEFTACGVDYDYHPEHTRKCTLLQWGQFVGLGTVIHAAD
jgi:hypothetical protein